MPEWTQAQRDLAALIDRVFADGKVDNAERDELRGFWAKRQMPLKEVRAVVDTFVEKTWGQVIADGVVTETERERLWAVVDGLHLPESVVPEAMWRAITTKKST
jgi:hypothetical protein